MESGPQGVSSLGRGAVLNEAQRRAVEHGDGPLLIVAGAGTGKTATLAHRVAHLVAGGADPRRILLLTFTRRAATEMLRRVEAITTTQRREAIRAAGRTVAADGLGANAPVTPPRPPASSTVWGGTFHAVAARLLRTHGGALGLAPNFTVMDRGDSEDLMNVCRTGTGVAKGARRFPQKSTCLDIYSRCVNAREPLSLVLATRFPWCREHEEALGTLLSAYLDRKEAAAVLDFDDLLVFWHALLADPTAGPQVRARFDHVLVDEYQDTNALQSDIVALLRPDGTGVTAVGDDAQAIYGFRAATVRNILDFPKLFPDAELVALERNYRSTQPVLDGANRLAAQMAERHDKELSASRPGGVRPLLLTCHDEPEQSRWIADAVLAAREEGVSLSRQAVLFRAAHHSSDLELELSRRDIPFRKYGGLRFAETAHVKDLAAFLRLAENPRDELAASRVLTLLPGIGPAAAQRLFGELTEAGGDFLAWANAAVPGPARHDWSGFVDLMRTLAGAESRMGALAPQVHAVRTFYGPILAERHDDAEQRDRDLEQLEAIASKHTDRAQFVAELAIDPPSWCEDPAADPWLDEEWLVLSTMHSAKGLEFDHVYVIHASDGNVPSDMATGSREEIDEERRLFYVACTRARDRLVVAFPQRYYIAGKGPTDRHGYAQPSRFMTAEVTACFDRDTAVPAVATAEPGGLVDGGTAAVRDELRAMWAS
jgi:DNA helicase-2/ATP-dependent DNA helicase PcrA